MIQSGLFGSTTLFQKSQESKQFDVYTGGVKETWGRADSSVSEPLSSGVHVSCTSHHLRERRDTVLPGYTNLSLKLRDKTCYKMSIKKIQAKRLFWRCHCKVSFVLWDPVEVLVSILSARTEGGGTEVPEVEHGQRREEEQDGLRVSGDEEHLG